jgi:small subunit ribosomal protein S14
MSNHIRRDTRRRHLVHRFEVERRLYKAMSVDMALSPEHRRRALLKLCALPRNSSLSRIRNRCVMSGRPRGVFSHTKLSRLCFREAASRGLLPGILKASW